MKKDGSADKSVWGYYSATGQTAQASVLKVRLKLIIITTTTTTNKCVWIEQKLKLAERNSEKCLHGHKQRCDFADVWPDIWYRRPLFDSLIASYKNSTVRWLDRTVRLIRRQMACFCVKITELHDLMDCLFFISPKITMIKHLFKYLFFIMYGNKWGVWLSEG